MDLGSASNWMTIVLGLVALITTGIGAIFWMSAIYFNGKATASSVAKVEKGLESIWNWIRRKHRKSDMFHMSVTNKLKIHESRIAKLESFHEQEMQEES